MLELTVLLSDRSPADDTLTLDCHQRQKSRLRVTLDSGRDAGLFLPRGTVLQAGQHLGNQDGSLIVAIRAAMEPVSTVRSADPRLLLRAAYHLGNRHVTLQVGDGWLRYHRDHVLDAMVQGLGLEILTEDAPFEPESGAYGGGHHHHDHHHD